MNTEKTVSELLAQTKTALFSCFRHQIYPSYHLLRDLYLYGAQRTLGSHVHIVNSSNFGNLYVTGPQEFIAK